jgi:hypothetical protein
MKPIKRKLGIITASERAALSKGKPWTGRGDHIASTTTPVPVAQFRKKGCIGCPPIPVYAKNKT